MTKRHFLKVISPFVLIGFVALGLALARPVLAVETGLSSEFQEATGLGGTDLRLIIANIIRVVLGLLGIIAVAFIVYSGFLWMTAAGNPDRVEKAKSVLINAVIGLVVVLASYAITIYVVGKIMEATGYEGGGAATSGGSSLTLDESASLFVVRGASPQGTQTIKNLVIRLTFNKDVDETTVEENIAVTASGASEPVDGTFTVSGRKVAFRPDALCDGYTDVYCFDANTTYTITIDEDLKSASGLSLTCGGLYDACEYTFTSGDLIDIEAPEVTISYPEDGDGIEELSIVTLQAEATDDAGISLVEFYVDGALVGEDQPDGTTPASFVAEYDWDTVDLTTGQEYDIAAVAYDVDDNETTSEEVTIIIRAAHCFNGVPDEDETGEDCGGADCGSCGGSSCTDDSECASGVCEGGVCLDVPEITAISPEDGASGIYVTISGENFGSRTGSVYFGETEAVLASCADPWETDEIIAIVPDDLTIDDTYAITVETADGYTDSTDDDNGPLLDGFMVNETERPGLCEIQPDEGEVGEMVTLDGVSFGTSKKTDSFVVFGTSEAGSYEAWDETEISVTVPTLRAKEYDVVVEAAGVTSNSVSFTVADEDAGEAPTIGSVDPDEGPVGTYLTISGENFGSTIGTVLFINTDTDSAGLGGETLADVDFPDSCEEDWWQRDQIIVKVPEDLAADAADFEIVVERYDDERSNAIDFTLTSETAGPGVCLLEPNAGPAGYAGLTAYGERFGDEDEEGAVNFSANDTDSLTEAAVVSWDDGEVAVNVPEDAVSGPVILTDDDGNDSNEVLFEVGDCNDDADLCDANTQQCCASGACVSSGSTCPEEAEVYEAHYAWVFSTGAIPEVPELVYECSDDVISPTPWDGRSGASGETVCVNAGLGATFDLVMDEKTMNDDNIILEQCVGSGDDPCDQTSAVTLSTISTTSYSFTVGPTADLSALSTYRITLTGGIESVNGTPIKETSWTFGTSDSDDLCELGSVMVSPSKEEINIQYATVAFNAQAVAKDACVILDSEDYLWDWTTDGTYADLAAATSNCAGSPSSCQLMEGLQETPTGQPTYALVEESSSGFDDEAELTINFTDPYVVDQWPDCSTACVNAAVMAKFNTEMDENTVLTVGAVELFACADENCDSLTATISGSVALDDDFLLVVFTPDDVLTKNTYYRVVLSGKIASTSGVSLRDSGAANLNYNNGEDYSWTFKTRSSDAVCEIDRVEMEPTSAVTDTVGAKTVFEARPYGPSDDCSVSGQPLVATSYDWAWAIEEALIASFWDDGDVQAIPAAVPDGCSSVCLSEGTKTYIGICGQDSDGDSSLLDDGEDCDDGNATDGDGCSSSCQNEGTEACASPTDSSCCGNQTLDAGEECDDGNATDGDGCSDSCLNEGSRQAGTTCGDGIITPDTTTNPLAGGEDCDDGNVTSGDGCSGICLNEGTEVLANIIGICGNSTVESPAEECDDGNATDGDGCSSVCLSEGLTACSGSTTTYCCGNGLTDVYTDGSGETCDDGNVIDGDGCSSVCLLEGSSTDYSEPSFCGDAVVGTGEQSSCEVNTSDLDGLVEPLQITIIAETAPAEVDSKTKTAQTEVTAEAEGEEGVADLILSCSCEADADCSDSVVTGCGTNGCCYVRPEIISYAPTASSVCRNAAISATFDQAMRLSSFDDNVTVELSLASGVDCPYETASARGSGFFGRLWRGFVRLFSVILRPLNAQSSICLMPITFEAQTSEDGQKVLFSYDELLEASSTYTVSIAGDPSYSGEGVRSENGVGLGSNYSFSFTTGTEICELESVVVTDADEETPNYFSQTDEAHDFSAAAYTTVDGIKQEIQAVSGLYSWEWGDWSISDADLFEIDTSSDAEGDDAVITALGVNGSTEISAAVTITEDEIFSPSTVSDSVTGLETITAFLCENPWPSVDSFPFEDSADAASIDPDDDGIDEIQRLTSYMNFSTYYCRDSGTDDTDDDLQAVDVVSVTDPPGEVLKEYLFAVGGDDVIGIRIVPNENYYSITDWYDDQGFIGSPSETTLDGYQALSDGRTTYVSAANKSDSDKIYPNVYAISYNANADQETIEIFEQMLENWIFNTNLTNAGLCYEPDTDANPSNDVLYTDGDGETVECSSDLDCSTENCHADKDKLIRDLQRLSDLRHLEVLLDDYGQSNGRCSATADTSCFIDSDCPGVETCEPLYPELESGSYLRAMSVSAWNSWDGLLTEALGEDVPADPLNDFVDCGTSPFTSFDEATCWNATESHFVCPTGSRTYLYRNVGGTAYTLQTDLEYFYQVGVQEWAYDFDQDTTDDLKLLAGSAFTSPRVEGFTNLPVCQGRIYGVTQECGDGVVGGGESCEIGDAGETSCTAAVCSSTDADYDGRACYVDCETPSSVCKGDANEDDLCDGGSAKYQACGTGEVDCTDISICQSVTTTTGTQTTVCNDMCNGYTIASEAECVPERCGNGVIEGLEACDDGTKNGDYSYCGSDCTYTSAFYCGDGTLAGGEVCDLGSLNGVYATSAGSTCNATCDGYGPYCGDQILNGSEECDDDETWSGALCADADEAPCETDVDCSSSATCGGTAYTATYGTTYSATYYLACPEEAIICDGGTYDEYPCSALGWDSATNLAGYAACTGAGGTCDWASPTYYPTYRTRTCDNSGSSATCTYNAWTFISGGWWTNCHAAGQICGDGEAQGTEECDDGDTDNNDSCTTECENNVCGDGYLYTGYETCDKGDENGELCEADYGGTCRYCSTACQYLTASGDYCGDGALDEEEEYCDASFFSTYWCYDYAGDIEGTCETVEALGTSTTQCDSGYLCAEVGVCDGGSEGGELCAYDSMCPDGDCIIPTCADDCGSTCPFTYSEAAVTITSEEAGASPKESLDLYGSGSGGSPDLATLTLPACQLANSLTADISVTNRELDDAEIIFILDRSKSMKSALGSSTRLEVMSESVEEAIDDLFDAYTDAGASLKVGLAYYSGGHGTDSDGSSYIGTDELDGFLFLEPTADEDEVLSQLASEFASVDSVIGTPLLGPIYQSWEYFETSSADRKIVVIFSDGNIYNSSSQYSLLTSSFGISNAQEYSEAISRFVDYIKDDEVEVFSAALATATCDINQMARWSSMDCAASGSLCKNQYSEGNYKCDVPENGITYAYSGSSADDLEGMFSDVVDAIADITVTIVDAEGNEGTSSVAAGDNMPLPLPDTFDCDEDDTQEVSFFIDFGGSGSINFSNLNLSFCEPE